ncbi:hypothetical protein AC578_6701 [Pseudocercospora eumusae]|uniref:BTB domain-containing protein n=1 Tax=Pseudocercospora eumusae TaxID=321146 RepID=A0A139HI72_9PEZI|nr:hypothetical protein AC578_6701 [Pseudocercospora eumusae]
MRTTRRAAAAPTTAPPAKKRMIVHSAKKVKPGALKRMYESGEWSDLTITVKDSSKTFAVHKTVLCPAWEFARAACTRGFVESKTSSIELPESEAVVDAILRYYYELPFKIPSAPTLDTLVKLRVAIDKYGTEGLVREVEQTFKQYMEGEDYPVLINTGLLVFAEAGECMGKMQQAIAEATGSKMSEIVRDVEIWSKMQESPEFLRTTLLEILPSPPVLLSSDSDESSSSDE